MEARDAQRGLRRLDTSVEESGGHARFTVATADSLAQDRLVHMGYLPIAEARFATRWFPQSANVRRYYDRFAASIKQMVLQSARLVPVPWEDALREFLRRVETTDLDWWIYGSAALAVRGLPIEPGDIDIHVNDAALTGRIFDDLLVTPVERMNAWVATYTVRAFCHVTIEWLSEPNAKHDSRSAPHEQGPFIADQIETVQWREHVVPLAPLSAQLGVCDRRGLTARADLIRSAMRRQ